jgi:hypothetical protein
MLPENTSDIVSTEPVWRTSSKLISVNTDETLVVIHHTYVKPRTHERAEPVMQRCTRGAFVRVDSI